MANQKQLGMTIIELIIALGLGVFLMSGITKVYIENKNNYVQDEQFARLQENGRYALNLFKHEVKMAGFFGKATKKETNQMVKAAVPPIGGTDCASGNWALSLGVADLSGNLQSTRVDFLNNVTGTLPTSALGETFLSSSTSCLPVANIQPGTDVLIIKRVKDEMAMEDGSATGLAGPKNNTWYLGTRFCADDNIIQFASATLCGVGNSDLRYEYVGSAGFATYAPNNWKMWMYSVNLYYVRKYSSDPPTSGKPCGDCIPTLVVASLQGNTFVHTPVVEGVEDLQLEYGVPDISNPEADDWTPKTYYSDYPNPTDALISRATVLKLYLLMRTSNAISGYTDNKTYTLGSNAAVTKTDGFKRHIFSSSIKIRNN